MSIHIIIDLKKLETFTLNDYIELVKTQSEFYLANGIIAENREHLIKDLEFIFEHTKFKDWAKILLLLFSDNKNELIAYSYLLEKLEYAKSLFLRNLEINLLHDSLKPLYKNWKKEAHKIE